MRSIEFLVRRNASMISGSRPFSRSMGTEQLMASDDRSEKSQGEGKTAQAEDVFLVVQGVAARSGVSRSAISGRSR